MNRRSSAVRMLAVVLVPLASCAPRAQANPPEPLAVNLAVATVPTASVGFRGTGAVVAAHTYSVAFEIPGRLTRVAYDIGDRVARGAVLATLDDTDERVALRAAQARALGADATVAKAEGGARVQERAAAGDSLATAHAQVETARAALDLARANARRSDLLFADGDVPAQAHDQSVAAERDAQSRLIAAQAQEAAAQAQRSLVNEGARREDRDAAHADALAAHAAVDAALATLAKTRILAPADAFVLTRTLEPGSEAQPGVVAFTLTDAATPDVVIAVPENALAAIHVGTRAGIITASGTRTGSVLRIEPAADTATRTANVRVHVPALDLHPGAVVDVELGSLSARGAAIPLGAIATDAGGSNVFVYDPATQRVTRHNVIVQRVDGDRALVAGLAPGTRVVSVGEHLLHPGDRVRVVASLGGER